MPCCVPMPGRPAAAPGRRPGADPVAAHRLPQPLGPYTLVRVLGSGGFGTVYEATRQAADGPTRVAVKLLHGDITRPDDVARFERERYLLASLDSPGIARFIESGRDEAGCPYLAMELVDGQPIDQYCDAARLGVRDRIRMVARVCRDVQAAHERLVAHLDLKPSNILVTAAGQAKIVDFGTSKLLAEVAGQTTTVRLTPHYASPEQLRHEPVSTACDTYSLGLILYELVTGGWPFGGKGSFVSTAERMLGRERQGVSPTRSRPTSPSVAGPRWRACGRADGRPRGDPPEGPGAGPAIEYATAGALADDLEALLDGRPIAARRPTLAYRASKLVARHPLVTAAAVVAAAVIAVLSGYAWPSSSGRSTRAGARSRPWTSSTACSRPPVPRTAAAAA